MRVGRIREYENERMREGRKEGRKGGRGERGEIEEAKITYTFLYI